MLTHGQWLTLIDTGQVEVDETVFGGVRHGKRGRGAEGKVLVAVAVELLSSKGFRHSCCAVN